MWVNTFYGTVRLSPQWLSVRVFTPGRTTRAVKASNFVNVEGFLFFFLTHCFENRPTREIRLFVHVPGAAEVT